jgi:hypothetical protein
MSWRSQARANQRRNEKSEILSNRSCTECEKKPPQVQCLHCSQHVCMECAQKHINLVAQESDGAVHLLNEKLDALDRIATTTRQKISAERDKIVQKADAERDRSFTLLAQMVEEEKQQLRNKNKQLNELPLNEIQIFIRKLKSDVQYLTENNDKLFNINSTAPQIILRRQHEESDETMRYNDLCNDHNN